MYIITPQVGLEPTTNRLTADRSTTELLKIYIYIYIAKKRKKQVACATIYATSTSQHPCEFFFRRGVFVFFLVFWSDVAYSQKVKQTFLQQTLYNTKNKKFKLFIFEQEILIM